MAGHEVPRGDLGECGLGFLVTTERGLDFFPVHRAARSKTTAFRRALLLRKLPARRITVGEQKSLGREMTETAHLIKRLDKAGVKVWTYILPGRQVHHAVYAHREA